MGKHEAPRTNRGNEADEKKTRRKKLILLLLLLLLVSLVSCTAWELWGKGPELTPDYAPQQEDENAQDIEGGSQEKMEKPEGGSSVNITYIPDVTIDLSEERATFLYQNPSRSNNDVVIQIVVQGEILAQSGKLVPGKQLTELELLSGAAKMLSPGGYDGKFVVLTYDPETAERTVLSAEGVINITVVE